MALYPTTGTTIRGDLNTIVEEAAKHDQFFIGHLVAPPFPVATKSGTFPRATVAVTDLLRETAGARSRGSSYPEISRAWTAVNYDCVDIGAEEAIDDTDIKDLARFFDLEAATANWVRRNVQLAYERRVSTAVMSTANFGSGISPVANYTTANLAAIDFPADVLGAIEAVRGRGGNPNAIVLSSPVFRLVRLAAKTQTWVSGQVQRGAVVNASSIQQSFADEGIEHVLVGRARYVTSAKGATPVTTAPCWANSFIWVGAVNQNARSLQDGGAVFTLVWNSEGGLFVTETYRDDKRRSNMVRVRQNVAEAVVDGSAGALITTNFS